MRIKILLKIIGYFGFLTGLPLILNQPLEAGVSACPRNVNVSGTLFKFEENGEWNVSVTIREPYSGSKEYLPARLGLAKLRAIEDFLKFATIKIKSSQDKNIINENEIEIKEEIIDFDKFNESMKFGKGPKFNWNDFKRSIASMKVVEECFDAKYKTIVLTAIWNSKDITNLNNQIALDDAYIDLFFFFDDEELDRLEKKYPNLYSTEDPNYLIDILKKNKKI